MIRMHGAFEVYALRGPKRHVAFRAVLPLIGEDATTTWIHCAHEGKFEGHPSGPFEFTREVFEQVLANFERQANPIVLTYEHPEHVLDDGIAAGWVHKMELRDDGLWAFVELTEKAAEHIRAGEFRYCSVVIVPESTDRETGDDVGAEIWEIGLTNVPFLDGLTPIKLSRRAASGNKRSLRMTTKEAVIAAIEKLGDEFDIDQLWMIVDEVQRAQVQDAVESVTGGETPDPEPDTSEANRAAASRKGKKLTKEAVKRALADLPEGVSVEDLKEAVAEAVQAVATEVADEVAGDVGEGNGEGEMARDDEDEEAVENQEVEPTAEDAAAGDLRGIVENAAEQAGMDLAAAIAVLRDNFDALVTMLAGGAEQDGAPSEGNADTALTRKLSLADKRIARLSKRLEELESERKERVEADRRREAEGLVDECIKLNKAGPDERDDLIEIALNDRKRFEAWMGKRQGVPTGRVTPENVPSKLNRSGGADDIKPRDEVEERFLIQLGNAVKDKGKALANFRAKRAQSAVN